MTETDNEKVSLKFWIASLAICMLVMAGTFAFLAGYLAEIKSNTAAALSRADMLSQRIYTMEAEIMSMHRYMLADKVGANPSAASAEASSEKPAAPVAAEKPANIVPAIQTPALAEPAKQ